MHQYVEATEAAKCCTMHKNNPAQNVISVKVENSWSKGRKERNRHKTHL